MSIRIKFKYELRKKRKIYMRLLELAKNGKINELIKALEDEIKVINDTLAE